MRSFFSSKSSAHGSTQSLTTLDESQALQDALRGATYIMDDDVETADRELSKGTSSFHKVSQWCVH